MENELTELYDLFDEFIFINEQPVTSAPNLVKETENLIKINFKGSNKTGLAFIFTKPLEGVDAEMVEKLITQALKLNRNEMAEVYLSENETNDIKEIANQLKVKKIVVWGVNSGSLYSTEKTTETDTLFVDEVSAFRNNIPLKTKLWVQLQLLISGK